MLAPAAPSAASVFARLRGPDVIDARARAGARYAASFAGKFAAASHTMGSGGCLLPSS